ncbi:MAG TPA: hypothetical protein VFR37_22970, partial [Longimicrobium sp.]|nr:hypothetical protein [Longimicrobium sp.]
MRFALLAPAVLACALPALSGCATRATTTPESDGGTLRAFRSEQELLEFNRQLVREYQKWEEDNPPPPAPPPPPPPP